LHGASDSRGSRSTTPASTGIWHSRYRPSIDSHRNRIVPPGRGARRCPPSKPVKLTRPVRVSTKQVPLAVLPLRARTTMSSRQPSLD
jgi:hypothetical protein